MEPFDLPGVAWTPVSPRLQLARRLDLLVSAAVLVAGLVVGEVLVASWWWIAGVVVVLAVGAWGWWLRGRQARAIAYAERDDDLLIRKGIMFRTLVVVPYGRLQYVDVSAGPIDRWLGIASVQLHTASAGSDAVVPGLVPGEAARLRDRLAQRGEARLAGL